MLSNGRVNCWGANSEGQLGDGTNIDSPVPVAVRSIDGNGELRNVRQLAVGGFRTCVLLDNRRVNCWGRSLFAGIGDGTTEARSLPVVVKGVDGNGALKGVKQIGMGLEHNCALLTTGRVACWGDNIRGGLGDGTTENALVPVAVKSANGRAEYRAITSIGPGLFHTCAVMGNRQVECWGFNSAGQLGDGTLTDSPLPVTVMTAS